MGESDPRGELDYESRARQPVGRRPAWVWAIIGMYILLAAAILLLPAWAVMAGDTEVLTAASIAACVLTLSGLGLIFTPVQKSRRRPITRRSVWIPILAAGTLLAGLVFAMGIALDEYLYMSDSPQRESLQHAWEMGIFIATSATWLGWALLFWPLVKKGNLDSLSARLHGWVLTGSVIELLVAVPTHIVVRRRTVCCAGYLTGAAICIGAAVMIVAFGPSIFVLYYRRWKRIQNR